ncbi:aromatic-L-amino-acid decarboxylase-like [Mizuhopecten yessoensis]|uniref:aromatic-L-amino-acid decarboxylase-like n=1 Tax=Mizuhopecten yessoensis TaxID=6573 RepID=UPI000B4595AE|nr:aromatic-L-amino-acid decarboxylase-like [Mizuhopecten yessoensis]
MNSEQFCENGRKMVDYISTYLEKIRDRHVVHNVTPGYMRPLLPTEAPQDPEDFAEVFKDIDKIIMPGVTHWHSPRFHGYFAAGNSYPSILGDMLSDAIGCIGFSWATSPACTELEVITTDWLGKMLGLPEEFLHRSPGRGGGVIQSTASETVLLCLLAARTRTLDKYQQTHKHMDEMEVMAKLVGYTSDQSNSSVGRSGLLGAVRMRKLDTDDKFSLRGETLRKAIEEDKASGLIPFFLCASLGTTGTCAFDNLEELGPICKQEDMWLHIDAAYAGSAFVCPEFRHLMKGVEYADTFSINPHKWMLINFDLSVMWIKDSSLLVDAFNVDPVYLRHENAGKGAPDYRHWQIPLGRRFRSLKLWFMLRSYGVTGVQAYIRKHVSLAKEFEQMVLNDSRFEVVADVIMGLVCFRLKGNNTTTERLLEEILQDGRIYLIPAIVHNIYTLRLAICAERTNSDDIAFSFSVIQSCSDRVLKRFPPTDDLRKAVIDVSDSQCSIETNGKYSNGDSPKIPYH